jgi:exosortase family protein XrtF
MRFQFLKNPIYRFLLLLLVCYLAWYLLYELWLHPQGTLDMMVIDFTIVLSKFILELLGYAVFTGTERVIGVDGTGGLWIGDNCNAIALFALFAGFIISFPGSWKKKLLYIPIGIVIIEILNVLRVVALAMLDTYSRKWTEFNHTYTFTIIIYGCIFLLWIIWVNRFSGAFQKKK